MTAALERRARLASAAFLATLAIAALAADWVAPYQPEEQFRETIAAAPSSRFWLGTDDLGRDRFSRLIHATRISLLIAPAAALLSVVLAASAGIAAATRTGLIGNLLMGAADITLSLPWLLLLLTVRSLLPLDVTPWASLTLTFALLGAIGWAGPARVIRAAIRELLVSDFVISARGRGLSKSRVFLCHVLPSARPVVAAQFWSAVPVFVLAEANLSFLGLGVTEPAASWGTMLKEMETVLAVGGNLLNQYWVFAPAALVFVSVLCLTILFPSRIST
ncbi:MAG: ABC transporter permease [Bryobacteraceae bacterium]|nr:ABC transporter permease [Bryobacteraceae bacterium]